MKRVPSLSIKECLNKSSDQFLIDNQKEFDLTCRNLEKEFLGKKNIEVCKVFSEKHLNFNDGYVSTNSEYIEHSKNGMRNTGNSFFLTEKGLLANRDSEDFLLKYNNTMDTFKNQFVHQVKKVKEVKEYNFQEVSLKLEEFVVNGDFVWKNKWENVCIKNVNKKTKIFIDQIGIPSVSVNEITEKTLLIINQTRKEYIEKTGKLGCTIF